MEGDAGEVAALPARKGRHPEGMVLAHTGRALLASAYLSSLRGLARRRDRSGPHAATGAGRDDRRQEARAGEVGLSWPLPSCTGWGTAQRRLHGGYRTAATD